MKTTKQVEREARQLFRLCLANEFLDGARVRQIVRKVIASKRRNYLTVLHAFQRLVRLHRAAHTAEVDCAAPLPADLRLAVQSRLADAYGQGIDVRFAHRPELIGGMRIKIGSDVYDGSVRSGLAALESSFRFDLSNRRAEPRPSSST